MKTRNFLTLLLAALLTLSIGCEKQNQQEGEEQPEAVEAEGGEAEGDEAAEKEEEEGAAKAEKDEEAADEEQTPTATVGEAAPNFELPDQEGEVHQLSDYRGKIVVIEWFNPGCPYVVRHHDQDKTMTKTLEEIGGADEIVWLAVDSTAGVEAKKAKEAREQWGFEYPVLLDSNSEVAKAYGAKTTPHMYIIDTDGILRYTGAIDDDPRAKKDAKDRTNHVVEAVTAIQDGEEVPQKQTKPYGCSVKYGS